jgi:hypothetical protein
MSRVLNFVLPNRPPEELEWLQNLDVDSEWQRFGSGPECWVLQTFIFLRKHFDNINLSNKTQPNAINFVHGGEMNCAQIEKRHLIVNLRADYPYNRKASYEIIQNKALAKEKAYWIPLWRQPGMIVRNKERTGCRTVGYFGRHINYYTRFTRFAAGFFKVEDAVLDICRETGLTLIQKGPNEWNDFSDVDAVLGIRSFSEYRYNSKPATKLTNAWTAGTVFIGGGDSAYAQIGTPGVDYLRATTTKGLRKELSVLHSNAEHFDALLQAGARRSSEFSREAVTSRWISAIDRIRIDTA